MKKDLKRIEDALHQLAKKPAGLAVENIPTQSEPLAKSLSFEVHSKPPKATAEEVITDAPLPPKVKAPVSTEPKPLNLPKVKSPNFSNLRHAANPSLASNLLRDMAAIVEGWHTELNQTLRDIQDLYLEGPIVDGWLESHSGEPISDASTLRHAEVDRLMNYIDQICTAPIPGSNEAPKTGYRLCGVNQDGQVWSCPCPAEQVPSLGLAIARYHKLRQLLSRKQDLETRLSQLAEKLVLMHGQMKD